MLADFDFQKMYSWIDVHKKKNLAPPKSKVTVSNVVMMASTQENHLSDRIN